MTFVHIQQRSLMEEMDPSEWSRERPAIVMLVPNHNKEFAVMKLAIQSMDKHLRDEQKTPILMFHEGNLSEDDKRLVESWTTTKRTVYWPLVSFQEYPVGFNPRTAKSTFPKRSKWGYQQMCRFWISRIWQHEAIRNYTTLMRIDTDSCFHKTPSNNNNDKLLPALKSSLVYRSNGGYWYSCKYDPFIYTQGLFNLTLNFVRDNNLTIQNPALWRLALASTKRKDRGLPMIPNNFEVDRIEFFQRPMVRAYQERIAEEEPFGVFRYRWGDAPVRLLTMAIFATPQQVDLGRVRGYQHGESCIEKAAAAASSPSS